MGIRSVHIVTIAFGCATKLVPTPQEALEADDLDWTILSKPKDEEVKEPQ